MAANIEQEADKFDKDKFDAKIKAIAAKHDLELDSDAMLIIEHITRGGFVQGVSKMIDKEWALNEAIRYWKSDHCRARASTTQRCFEFICELANLLPQGKSGITPVLADVDFTEFGK